MDYTELKILIKVLMPENKINLKKLFEQYSKDDNLDADQFEKLCLNSELFSIKSRNKFFSSHSHAQFSNKNVSDSKDAFQPLVQKIFENLD